MHKYDAVVVGSGTAGQTAAYALRQSGMKVAVVEKTSSPGGVCAQSGCQPKKWFYEAAETIARCRNLTGKGIVTAPQASWTQVLKEKNRFTTVVPANTVKGFQQAGIVYLEGQARFQDHDTLTVNGQDLAADAFVIATGAHPMSLSFPGAEHLLTSDDWLNRESLPERILFVGGGFIAFEFAHFAVRLGPASCRAVILEAGGRPLGPFDAEMVDLLVTAGLKIGITVHTNVEITAIEKTGAAFSVHTASGRVFTADQVVHGAGRTPDIEDLNLENAGITYERSGIVVDAQMRTTNPKVFAIGDCAATVQLARVADYEAHAAAKNILADADPQKLVTVDYTAVPAVLFTSPQLGMVGQTEAALQQQNVPYRKSFAKNLRWPTYRRVGLEDAAYKILTDAHGRFLGAHFLSDNTSGMLNTIRLAVINGITAEALYKQSIMSPYPSRESDVIYMLKALSG